MFSFWTVMYLLFVGIVAGFLARLLVKGTDPMPIWQTILIGVLGSYAGGFGAYVLFGWDKEDGAVQPGGIISSIIGAVVVLLIWRAIKGRSSSTTP